ncbi:GNAT family N-acetyltransferase [Vagococcus coleopterorum]|uniref:GNAT family N-acetyltransferase n=1 Tax=Vagococcus coleopterorum TaxID=2714946 RepID=A0A6G8ANX5_9ENTE|nr:N-acetyltransferase [Vagococcus coleopterorum]QIL46669.1 GNAT family N-acetyltransferase [Vagococcus coleopterorum]
MMKLIDSANDAYPWDLLLLADPEKEIVESYLYASETYVYQPENSKPLGVIVLSKVLVDTYEIMNIAVSESAQGKGIGKHMLNFVLKMLQERIERSYEVVIKTGETSTPALKLYQSVGFEITEIVKDYFVEHYQEPIFENGQQLKNQVILKKELKAENINK